MRSAFRLRCVPTLLIAQKMRATPQPVACLAGECFHKDVMARGNVMPTHWGVTLPQQALLALLLAPQTTRRR